MTRRRFYAIAHHCNVISDLERALEAGANAIECDVEWHDGLWVRHPAALREPFPSGTPLGEYLPAAREKAHAFNERFALVIFDIKPTLEREHVADLLSSVRAELSEGSGLNVLLTVPKTERLSVFDDVAPSLGGREGIGVDEEDDPNPISDYFARAGVTHGCYGNGIDSVIPYLGEDPIEEGIRRAVELRDTRGAFRLVYRWTLNTKPFMRKYLDLGVDAIMTDQIDDLVAVLREDPYRESAELAGREHNPFA